ncbi:hypothetical protein FEM48_Zijuj10G0001900 [Ziziphus jujuba var. spinosa]|uniref:Uncharacterized protein n=1 Tax=Ziziphus jujuba var. spinosa TaxID=714518 RepID=A0A978UK48_ZIZJJ|nr:hypothetical protein FEM48_Zijuj10G0001900 [Ziziphus jujuba var. spinosa]
MKLYEAPKLTARIFRLSVETVAKLKANANAEYSTCNNSNNKKTFISSYQSVSAIETGATLVLGLLQKFSAHHPGDCNGWGVERERESVGLRGNHTISISSILVNDCTKFNISGKEFGILGKPIAFNFGDRTHMIDGYVYAYSDPDPDPTAAGDILVEVSLLPHTMRDLQADQEFMQFIS